MTQITVADLNNAKLDVDTIANIANSTATSVTDRLGNQRRTLYSLSNEFPNASENAAATAADRVQTGLDAVATAADRVQTGADVITTASARDAALLSRGVFATTAKALSNGVINYSSLVAGTSGTDGTFAISFSGGAGTGAAGYFTVASGSITSITFTATGDSYTSAPAMSFAASSGLTGASATAVIGANVNSGEYFSVVASDSNEYLILYLNDSGAAVEQKRYPSAVPIDLLINGNFSSLGFQFKKLAVESGYSYALVDSANRAAILIGLDGAVTFPKYAVQTTVTGLVTDVDFLKSGDFNDLSFKFRGLPVDTGYSYALVDSVGRAAILIGLDGTVTLPKYSKDAYIPQSLISDSGYVWAVLDAAQRAALAIKADGSLVFNKSNYLAPSRNIWCLGDSLTEGGTGQTTWRQALPDKLTIPRAITNWARGGHTSTMIAARAGAYCALLTVSGNSIPTSGAVAVTSSVDLLYALSAKSITGKLNGIAGTLTRDISGNYTFTRTTAGTAVYCGTKLPFNPDIYGHDFDTFVMCMGRNNLGSPADIIRDIELCCSFQKTIEKRFLIITPPTGGTLTTGVSTNEGTGSTTLANVKQIEDWATQKYGDRVLKVREFSFQYGNGSADDLDDIAKETVPRSLRIDTIHWNNTLQAYVADWVASQINSRGW